MIKVNVSKDYIVITGHANYADYGKDIVCSAVSSTVITTCNAIMKFDKNLIKYEELKDKVTITINSHNEIVDNLISNMIDMLQELEKDYPKNINIRKENL